MLHSLQVNIDVESVGICICMNLGFAFCFSPTPPPPTRIHEGAACVFPFSRERGVFLAVISGRFPRENPEKGCVFLPMVINTRDRGHINFPR